VLVELLVDELPELFEPLDEDPVDELEEVEEAEELEELEELADGAVGAKVSFLTPKPRTAASVPLPTIAIVSFSFRLVITSLPLLLSDAVTCALVGRSTLMALIRSPTVSVPVDVYVVALKLALMVIVPPDRIPRLESRVPVVSTAVLMPVAGAPDVLVVPEVPGDLELEEDDAPVTLDDDEPERPCSKLWTPATSWELTRCKASPLAILARPLPKLVSADCMALITVSVAETVASQL